MFEHKATLSPVQMQQHLAHSVPVPDGVTRLVIDLEYAPHITDGFRNLLTLTVFDPKEVRGEGHKHKPHEQVILSAAQATPGYTPGPIPSGEWTIIINTHMVQEALTYHLRVQFVKDDAPNAVAIPFMPGQTAPRGAGWYRGDLHGHTRHSDANWDIPDFIAYARAQQLDFVTLTDHNTISGVAEMKSHADDALLVMGGMELTTFFGHAVALGIQERVDWRLIPGQRSMTDILRQIEQGGGLFVIAHPHSIGNPACTGCDWQYAELMPGAARLVEVWNGTWSDPVEKNPKGLAQWYTWLNAGWRMIATAGSDIHGLPASETRYGRNVVYAAELSERAILDALRQGHHYLSAGPRLVLTATNATGEQVMMGDALTGLPATFTADWADVPPGGTLRWIVDGAVHEHITSEGAGTATLEGAAPRWIVAEIRDERDHLLAVTNPIFCGAGWG